MAVLTREQAQASPSSIISREEIQDLVQVSSRPCVSIYMPTVRAGTQTQQNPIRFKNLLRTVQERLVGAGKREAEVAELLAPVRDLENDYSFWQRQSDGLAVFFAPGFLRTFKLPMWLDELALVENRFHLKPLFSLLSGDGRFYVLALSMNRIRLLEATRHDVREVDLETADVPLSLNEAQGTELEQQNLQFHVNTPAAQARLGSPRYHGHGLGEDDGKPEIEKFFQQVDRGLQGLPLDRRVPLVLAGVEYLQPLYKEANSHPMLAEGGVAGNPEGLAPEELRDAAWRIVEPLFLEDRRKAAARYAELAGTGRATSRYEEVLPAAHDGRVDTLFVARGVRLWGRYDPESREIRLQEDQTGQLNGGEDLLDLAAVRTFLNGGQVYAVPQQEIPDGHAMAAVFRY